MDLQLIGTFEHCRACTLEKAKKARISKIDALHLLVKDNRLFFDVNSTSTAIVGWLFVGKDTTDYIWNYFFFKKIYVQSLNHKIIKRLKNSVKC